MCGREALRGPSDSDSESLCPQGLTGSCPRTGSRLSAAVEGACPTSDPCSSELTSDPLHSNDIVDFELTFPKTALFRIVIT